MSCKDELKHDYKKAFEVFKDTMREGDYLLAVKSALEKQIPKKPFKEVIAKKNTRMVCPVCFVSLHYLVEQQNYCPDCGQALDWSDTNDR